MQRPHNFIIGLLTLVLIACSSTPNRAPVIDRSPEPPKPKAIQTPKKLIQKTNLNSKDWRPESYTVKKGDTLYSIGLEFGEDYKDIAQNNNINAPYNIRVGQQLKIKSSNITSAKIADTNNDEVVIKPLNNDSQITPSQTSSGQTSQASSADIPTIRSPKALRGPYNEEAEKDLTKPAEPKTTDIKSSEQKPLESAVTGEDALDWSTPTKGKLKAGFNEGASAKGIDIEGAMGQDINAAANGKVIYSGSDLRGYGNLVIVKHNKDYLSVYAHNSKILVKEGQTVIKGQKIAEMGSSGTDVVKLHFEIRYQGKSIDPAKFLANL
ncbi:peptidoglycan DD-metalloendopeptidase family protein [Candidatus Methylopumilus turicensis]|uniref:Peptidase M23 n=1 Tax=Candidatus Methylopumilus turicensis TaxID=1581680 RepID=A0A0B7J016_9PROT|nr:peptidoglycan DD-metalloendopeptidase family protein [Candidatus Methylopumilus turicensis]CEN56097.1 Peptidase M23 [Candidatus Methylopumilus turicensis]